MGKTKGSDASNERSKESIIRTTLSPLSPPISHSMTYQNRYASLLPEAESFDAMAGVNEDTADEEWAAVSDLREEGATKEPPRKRSRLRAEAGAFNPRRPPKPVPPGCATSGRSREELVAASQKMLMRKEITKLRAEAASFSPSRKESERLPPISIPTPKETSNQEPISMELGEYMKMDTA